MKTREEIDWANRQLSMIADYVNTITSINHYKKAVAFAIRAKEDLLRAGYWWQAKRADNWIHLAMQRIKEIEPGYRIIMKKNEVLDELSTMNPNNH